MTVTTKIEWVKNKDGSQGRRTWNVIPSFSDYYVSIDGRILSKKTENGKILSPIVSRSGHMYVFLYKNRKMFKVWVHRAVLEAFFGPPGKGQECRHLDGNPSNNHISNLSWGTRKENIEDKWRHGTMPIPHESKDTKLKPTDIPLIHGLQGKKSSRSVGKMFGTSHTTIQKIWRGERWKGYESYGNYENTMV